MKKIFPRISILIFLSIFLYNSTSYSQQNKKEHPGYVKNKSGNSLSIKMDGPDLPEKEKTYEVMKFFKKKIFGMNTTGWLHVAVAKVTKINGKIVYLHITEYKSDMTVNKKKVIHLKPGVRVKLVQK